MFRFQGLLRSYLTIDTAIACHTIDSRFVVRCPCAMRITPKNELLSTQGDAGHSRVAAEQIQRLRVRF